MGFLTDLVYVALAIVTSPWWARKSRSGWAERFGKIDALPVSSRPRVLLHAVSVGEVNLLRSIVRMLATDCDVVVASTTDTGMARARQLYDGQPHMQVVRYPLDASWAVRRFLDAVRPDVVGLVELELWPNFARACRRRGVPLAIINGRLSHRSVGGYRLARPILGKWFGSLAFCGVQDETYRQRFIEVGVQPEHCSVVGTMKWDAATVSDQVEGASALADDMGIDQSKPLIVAGSTAPDEHALLHEATPPGVQLLCAPRKPEWFDDAALDLPGCVRRSASSSRTSTTDRFLLDTIGELRKAYALADLVVVGRSFGELYGSDPMEPAALGKAIIIGPSVADFATTVKVMRAYDAIVQVDRESLKTTIERLLQDEARRSQLAGNAQSCVREHQGASSRYAAMLRAQLEETQAFEGRRLSKEETEHVRV